MTLDKHHLNISLKANKVLNVILIALLLIILRIWHLTIIQHHEKLEQSRKPQVRLVLEPAKRGTIRDRFNVPLALNQLQYNASIIYAPLRQIPTAAWEKDAAGKKIKVFKRKEYIKKMAGMLGQELQLDPTRLEDLIHAKAALYYSLPFVIKEGMTEKEYYRLKMMEKDWPGVYVQLVSKRDYPKGKLAADIIGYMGAINKLEYEAILEEIKTLQIYLQECDEGVSPELPGGTLNHMEALQRLKDLQEHAYVINDYIGKTGIEGKYEQELRGFHGQRAYHADAKGNLLQELPQTRNPLSGQRMLLTISSELQEYAELLLAQNEKIREPKVCRLDAAKQTLNGLRQPWIKGGSIIAIDPGTGEILAMASYPRFDPNDFIASGNGDLSKRRKMNIVRWFESDSYLGEIWDCKRPLEKELYDDALESFYDEEKWMTWQTYLSFILSNQSPLHHFFNQYGTIRYAIELQQQFETFYRIADGEPLGKMLNVIYSKPEHIPLRVKQSDSTIAHRIKQHVLEINRAKQNLAFAFDAIPENYDKVLLADLCRMVVHPDLFSAELLNKVGHRTLESYRQACAAKNVMSEVTKKMAREIFHDVSFKEWREQHEKPFLKELRQKEKEKKLYAKPYIDYLDAKEAELFEEFWKRHAADFLLAFLRGTPLDSGELHPYAIHFNQWHLEIERGAHQELPWRASYRELQKTLKGLDKSLATPFLNTMRSFNDLNRPLFGRYRYMRKEKGIHLEKHLAAAFYPMKGFAYSRPHAYRQAAPQGSIFKLVTAYAVLTQRYREFGDPNISIKKLNPLTITDQTHRQGKDNYVGYLADGTPLPREYKGGRLPRSTHVIGKIDLLKAIENSSNPYFSLLAGDILQAPQDLVDAAQLFAYGSKTGIDLPGEISGNLPSDLNTNRTGLYATAIGQHSLVVTPLQTAVMLSCLANGGQIIKPKILKLAAGKKPQRNLTVNHLSLYNPYRFPIEAEIPAMQGPEEQAGASLVTHYPSIVQRTIFLPAVIRKILLEGMRRVVIKTQEECIASLSRFYRDYPEAISDYLELKDELVGKTSTAEVVENLDLDPNTGTNLYTHVWFGGIAFNREGEDNQYVVKDRFGNPELVVVVYLRYGAYGKEAAPIAAQMVRKWRDIKKKMKS